MLIFRRITLNFGWFGNQSEISYLWYKCTRKQMKYVRQNVLFALVISIKSGTGLIITKSYIFKCFLMTFWSWENIFVYLVNFGKSNVTFTAWENHILISGKFRKTEFTHPSVLICLYGNIIQTFYVVSNQLH